MFRDKLTQVSQTRNSLLCVGLDPFEVPKDLVKEFNRSIIDSTADVACSFKPNLAIYEGLGPEGLEALHDTIEYIRSLGLPVIGDGKRGDIENCGKAYAQSLFRNYKFDAVTISPYMGRDVVTPFLVDEFRDGYIFVLTKTSNKSAGDFEDLEVHGKDGERRPFFLEVARQASSWDADRVGFVVGATYVEEIKAVRAAHPQPLILIPGVGTQNGSLRGAVQNAADAAGSGFILSVSRSITFVQGHPSTVSRSTIGAFAKSARQAALEYRDGINEALELATLVH